MLDNVVSDTCSVAIRSLNSVVTLSKAFLTFPCPEPAARFEASAANILHMLLLWYFHDVISERTALLASWDARGFFPFYSWFILAFSAFFLGRTCRGLLQIVPRSVILSSHFESLAYFLNHYCFLCRHGFFPSSAPPTVRVSQSGARAPTDGVCSSVLASSTGPGDVQWCFVSPDGLLTLCSSLHFQATPPPLLG